MGEIRDEIIDVPLDGGRKPLPLKEQYFNEKEGIVLVSIKENDLFIGKLRFDWIIGTKVKIGNFIYKVRSYKEIMEDVVQLILYDKFDITIKPTQYYYPSLEELHIGWEGQINGSVGYTQEYQDFKVTQEDLEDYSFWDSCTSVRCPLLTKEQIEKEGWEFNNPYSNCENLGYLNNHKLIWFPEVTESSSSYIRIVENGEALFYGECPTINHLRQIMNLLNIHADKNKQ